MPSSSAPVVRLRLVRRDQPATPRIDLLDEVAVAMRYDANLRLWRSERAAFAVRAARAPGTPGAFHAIGQLADDPVYRLALWLPGRPEDGTATLQSRLDAGRLWVEPRQWRCSRCRTSLAEHHRPCGTHLRSMPPAVLYRTITPHLGENAGRYWVFGLIGPRDWNVTSRDPAHNDRDLGDAIPHPTAALAEQDLLRVSVHRPSSAGSNAGPMRMPVDAASTIAHLETRYGLRVEMTRPEQQALATILRVVASREVGRGLGPD